MRYALIPQIDAGQPLIPVTKYLSQEKINTYGVATGSTGPVHVDPKFCASRPMKHTLAHGFLTMAYISEMMEINFGGDWFRYGKLTTKFVGGAGPDDTVIARGVIENVTDIDGGRRIACKVEVVKQDQSIVVIGTAELARYEKTGE